MIYSIFDEGQQADDYRARKAKEAEKEKLKYKDQALRRYPSVANNYKDNYGDRYTKDNPEYRKDIEKGLSGDKKAFDRWDSRRVDDSSRKSKSAHIGNKDYYSGKRPMNGEENARANDAVNRHMRRHPDQYKESSIFESVEFI